MGSLKHSRSFALVVALLTLFALVLPLSGIASATHTSFVDAEPESDVNAPRTSHTVTAYTSAPGIEVNFNIECNAPTGTNQETSGDPDGTYTAPMKPTCTSPNTNSDADLLVERTKSDFECTTGATADAQGRYSCSWTYTDSGSSSTSQTDHIRAWSDHEVTTAGGDDEYDPGEPFDVVTKTWETNPLINCEPETGNNPTTGPDSDHTITCTVQVSGDNGGGPLANANVDFENENKDVNDPDNNSDRTNPDRTCTTDAQGQCSVTYQSEGQTGTAPIRAWVDINNSNTSDDSAPPCSTDPTKNETPENTDCENPTPDSTRTEKQRRTDVVTKTWAAPAGVDAEPQTDTNPVGSNHTITAYTPQSGVEVNFNIESGPHSNDNATNPLERTSSDYECVTGGSPDAAGRYSCSWTYQGKAAGKDNVRVWIDTGSGSAGNDDTYQQGEPNDYVEKNWYTQNGAQAKLDCVPETGENPTIGPESSHTITCTVTDQFGQPFYSANVDFENETPEVNDPDNNADRTNPDKTCTTAEGPNGNGQCSVTYDSESQGGTATIRAWVDADKSNTTVEADASETQGTEDSDGTDVVTKTWEAVRIDASPNDDRNPIGAQHTIVAATDQPGVEVNFNIETGPHSNDADPVPTNRKPSDFECVTDNDPAGGFTCSYTYTGSKEGTDSIRVWFDEGANDDTFQQGEPNDLVTKTWYTQNATQARLDCNPETDRNPAEGEGSAHTISCTVLDQEGRPFFGARVHFENETPTVNDPDDNADRKSPDKTCSTPPAPDGNGQCDVTYTSEGQAGTATIRAWVDSDKDAATDNADAAEIQTHDDQDGTDVVTKTWVGDARTIDCAPDTAVNPVDTDHVITCTVLDRGGNPVAGEDVNFTSSGVGFVNPTGGRTDEGGRVRTTARSREPGEQRITATITDDLTGNEPTHVDECDRAAGDPQGAPAGRCADTVTKTWEPAENPQCSDEIDNDGDGKVDHPADPGCSSATDNNETDETEEPVVQRGPCSGYPQNSSTPIEGGNGNVIVGSPGDDVLTGTDGNDIICALGGHDVVDALGGKDQVVGNSGNDSLSGREGNDTLDGGTGNDSLKGNAGIDTLRGRDGDDTLQGGRGEDTGVGGDGNDVMRGYSENDTLIGGKGRDVAKGGKGRKDICRAETETGCERN